MPAIAPARIGVKSLDWRNRRGTLIAGLPGDVMEDLLLKLGALLALSD
jgi:hypothetical protein